MKRSEADTQVGRIVLEQELLNERQMKQCHAELSRRRHAGAELSLGVLMVELGYLTPEQLRSVRAESRRRACRIHGYEILDQVGAGSVGTVYRARQIKMERNVAIKILRPDLAANPDTVKAYIAEAQAVAKLNHPHIVQGIDVGESEGHFFFAMEFLVGGSFEDVLGFGPIDEEDGLIYMYQVASALAHAQQRNMIHCDIKPANLMLDDAGRLKLTDLGLATFGDGTQVGTEGGARVVRGTPHYLSPEQITRPDDLDARTDIYSLGATFYHLLSGQTPFSGSSSKEIILARLRQTPAPLRSVAPHVSEGLGRLVDEMLSVDRNARPSGPEALMQRLVDLGVDVREAGDLRAVTRQGNAREKPRKSKARESARRKAKRHHRRIASRHRTAMRGESSSTLLYVGIALVVVLALLALLGALGSG